MTDLDKVLKKYARVAVVGQPNTGKTSLANKRTDVIHTDDYKELGWKESASAALEAAKEHDSYVVEGVTAARAVREDPSAFDAVIVLEHVKDGSGNRNINKGIATVLSQVDGVPMFFEDE